MAMAALAVTAALQDTCTALRQPLGSSARAAEAAPILRDARTRIKPESVTLILAEGPWRVVWATPIEAERGVYFYRRSAKRGYRLVDTWGGVIPPEERASTVQWAQALPGNPPKRLAGCFADALLADY